MASRWCWSWRCSPPRPGAGARAIASPRCAPPIRSRLPAASSRRASSTPRRTPRRRDGRARRCTCGSLAAPAPPNRWRASMRSSRARRCCSRSTRSQLVAWLPRADADAGCAALARACCWRCRSISSPYASARRCRCPRRSSPSRRGRRARLALRRDPRLARSRRARARRSRAPRRAVAPAPRQRRRSLRSPPRRLRRRDRDTLIALKQDGVTVAAGVEVPRDAAARCRRAGRAQRGAVRAPGRPRFPATIGRPRARRPLAPRRWRSAARGDGGFRWVSRAALLVVALGVLGAARPAWCAGAFRVACDSEDGEFPLLYRDAAGVVHALVDVGFRAGPFTRTSFLCEKWLEAHRYAFDDVEVAPLYTPTGRPLARLTGRARDARAARLPPLARLQGTRAVRRRSQPAALARRRRRLGRRLARAAPRSATTRRCARASAGIPSHRRRRARARGRSWPGSSACAPGSRRWCCSATRWRA